MKFLPNINKVLSIVKFSIKVDPFRAKYTTLKILEIQVPRISSSYFCRFRLRILSTLESKRHYVYNNTIIFSYYRFPSRGL